MHKYRNSIIIVCVLIFLFAIFAVIFILTQKKPESTPVALPTPTIFPTTTPPPQEEAMQIQSEADRDYGEWQKTVYETYPWYNQLPLKTDNYYVYFDLDTKEMIAYLYPAADTPEEQQITLMKREILRKLQLLNTPFEEDSVRWVIEH